MNLGVMAAVFPVIFLGELPDKTMMASLLLAARGRALAVWVGGAAAFAIHVVIATSAGVLVFRLLPPGLIGAAVTAVFAAGALLAARAAWQQRPGPPTAASVDAGQDTAPATSALPASTGPGAGPAAGAAAVRTGITAFMVIFAAEWGDLTQILTANLSAHYHAPLSVGAGAMAALWSVAALAVLGGRRLGRHINPFGVHTVTAVLLAGLATYTAWTTIA